MKSRFSSLCALGALVTALGALVDLAQGDGSELVDDAALLDTRNVAVKQSIVKLHNLLRGSVNPHAGNMLRMEWNDEAGNNSYLWSLTCTMDHSPAANRKTSAFGCGENLFLSSAPFTWEHAIRDWFNEVDSPGFDYGKGARTPGAVGHYTQVVWYSSYQVGCAVTYCPNSESVYKYLYVCQYCPQGNLNTRLTRPYDLGEPCALCPNSCDNGNAVSPLYTTLYTTLLYT
ncbi:cysteine-rich venom protein TEL1-like, partial [Petromyzon marinus]|uniref:cysteine-rich venom protein TEL1-like n=2 Tax=Petromyzon marinus TaxID=7757 RepID=UPI003F6FB0C3